MAAARSYRVEVVRLLLEAGADVQRQTSDGFTALHAAVGEVSRTPELQGECVRLLLTRGAAPDGRTASGLTALMNAAWVGCLSAVQALLDAGASPAACDPQDARPRLSRASEGTRGSPSCSLRAVERRRRGMEERAGGARTPH
jgi:ankyrin repeat protein